MATSKTIWDRNTELRKVGEGDLHRLITSLELEWQKVMENVPADARDVDLDSYIFKYKPSQIAYIQSQANNNRHATIIFLEEWKTSGRYRATLETVRKLVTKLNLYGAMTEMAELLGDPQPPRPPQGPGALISVTQMIDEEQLQNHLENMKSLNTIDLSMGTVWNKNIDKPGPSGNISYNKNFPDYRIPESQRSTGTIQNETDFIKFTQSLSYNDTPIESSGNLPVMLQQDYIPVAQNSIPTVTVQSATSDSNGYSQFSSNSDVPNVSLLNGSSECRHGPETTDNYNETYLSDYDNSDIPAMVTLINKSEEKKNSITGIKYKYTELKKMARGFSDESDIPGRRGGLIGKGGFGEVYVGFDNHQPIAIKRFINPHVDAATMNKLFEMETEIIHIHHINLVRLLGYADDGPEKLIVSEYIEGGNLSEKLSAKVLNQFQRLKILQGTARGLQFLHHGTKKKYIHKDVKSPNILLTNDCVPKLCDFGLMRENDAHTTQLIGTPAYIAPEATRKTITQKMDVYSFGIVILEVLTGLEPVIQCNPGSKNIECYINEKKHGNDITHLIDSTVKDWPIANELFEIATRCLAQMDIRPDTNELCQLLEFGETF